MRKRQSEQAKISLSEALVSAFERANTQLQWVNAEKLRYYHATLQRDLLGDLIVVQMWGGIGTRRGGMKNQFFTDLSQARTYINHLHQRRLKHGYILKIIKIYYFLFNRFETQRSI